MKNNSIYLIYILLFISNHLFADLISVSGNSAKVINLNSRFPKWDSNGQFAKIIDPPETTIGFYADVEAMVGFNEKQNVTLLTPLEIDGNKLIDPGTVVNSHIIFLTIAETDNSLLYQKDVQWEFDSEILGVMSDYNGYLLFQSSPILGAEGTVYHPPDTSISAFGMENGNDFEKYTVNGNILTITMTTIWAGPGDWIRVITQGDNIAVPEPSSLFLILFCIPLIAFKKRNK